MEKRTTAILGKQALPVTRTTVVFDLKNSLPFVKEHLLEDALSATEFTDLRRLPV
jgi:hypothetical protein